MVGVALDFIEMPTPDPINEQVDRREILYHLQIQEG